ncbi:MAG: hypothetical protein KDB22_25300 [Planctomycetales bacterium]|nr:hypothetical protein [Planctomycetales bacterium]
MSPIHFVSGLFVFLGVATLLSLLRRRQNQLHSLLREYVDAQMEWAIKKAKAKRVADRTARKLALTEAELQNAQESQEFQLPASSPEEIAATGNALANFAERSEAAEQQKQTVG